VRKPPVRLNLPVRRSNNDKRRLIADVSPVLIEQLLKTVHFRGSPKHKKQPHLFDLPPYNGERGDETLCDDHAGFTPRDMESIPRMIRRGINAGLTSGTGRIFWTIGDNGWIYECRLTNVQQAEYHGYPIRRSEPICEPVYRRFVNWAERSGSQEDKNAAVQCKALYGFR